LKTAVELQTDLGDRVKIRRIALGFSQKDAATRAGVAYRTWRRMEAEGKASIEDLVKAALALRCEEGVAGLFPGPEATSMDELLRQQKLALAPRLRVSAKARATLNSAASDT
jgi:transcriptional regulator with XRE-family HTH domain